MVKNLIVALGGFAAVLTVVALWLRVRQLEQSVDSLTRQLQSLQVVKTLPVHDSVRQQNAKKKSVFRLIGTETEYNEPVTGPFPDAVDRAMMSDGIDAPTNRIENNDQSTWQIEVTPKATIDLPNSNTSLDSIHLRSNGD